VEKGSFRLRAVIGSRQWGGREANIDIEPGAFDPKTCDHVGEPSWRVYQDDGIYKGLPRSEALSTAKKRILDVLRDTEGASMTKTKVEQCVKGNSKVFDTAYNELIDSEHITCTPGGRNGQAKMTALGPTHWKTVGEPEPSSKPNQTNQTEPDQLDWSGSEGTTEQVF
jgi:hypothetical protein